MELSQAIESRRSVRAFEGKPIDEAALAAIVEAARLAPSARNRQDWRFVVVAENHRKQALARAAAQQMFIADAGVIIAGCMVDPRTMSCGMECGPIDVAIALTHMTLKAVELGLGSCWIGAFSQEEVKSILSIPGEASVVQLLAVGHPAENPVATPRLKQEQIVCYEQWNFE